MYREGPTTAKRAAELAHAELGAVDAALERLVDAGRIERCELDGAPAYRAHQLVIPLGSAVGWEAAVFDHYQAVVTTIISRLRGERVASHDDRVGGSTYTIDVWDDHPLAEEVYGSLAQLREELSGLRARVATFNAANELPEAHTRAVIYVGQCLIQEGHRDAG
jgi:hypothetical protein